MTLELPNFKTTVKQTKQLATTPTSKTSKSLYKYIVHKPHYDADIPKQQQQSPIQELQEDR